MMYVTSIYDDKGRWVREVSKCDHTPLWCWWDMAIGVIVALIVASVLFV